jgi:small-conductance mechanosensitive channel
VNWSALVTPYALILGSLVVGLIFERVILVRLRRLAVRTRNQGDDIISSGLRGAVVLWFVLAGIFAALRSVTLDPEFEEFAIQFLRINLVISVTWVAMRMISRLVGSYVRRSNGILGSTTIFTNLTRILVAVLGALIALQALGVPITPLVTTLGVGGIAVALALQDTLANIFAGLYIIASNKIRLGDYVRLAGGEEGFVRDINWRNTTIQALANNMVIVPNLTVASAVVTNFNLPEPEVAVTVPFGVSYDSDLELVERIAAEVAREVMREVEGGLPEFEPLVRFSGFAETRVSLSVVMRARQFTDQFLVTHEFVRRLHGRFRREGIEFLVPVGARPAAPAPPPPATDE